jgi:chemotaxis protein MotB
MLLLFALFLVLYSTTKREETRLRDEIAALKASQPRAREPVPEEPDAASAGADEAARTTLAANADLQEKILVEAKAFLSIGAAKSAHDRSDVEVLDLANGDFMVRVAAPDLFAPGESRVAASMRPFVDRLGELIVRSGRRLRIEGHADFDDSEAIQRKSSAFANTWELSAARAAALAQYWMRRLDLRPERIEVASFGKYRPLEAKPGRPPQANRRIEIVILRVEK